MECKLENVPLLVLLIAKLGNLQVRLHAPPMLHGHDNIEMDTTRGYMTNFLK